MAQAGVQISSMDRIDGVAAQPRAISARSEFYWQSGWEQGPKRRALPGRRRAMRRRRTIQCSRKVQKCGGSCCGESGRGNRSDQPWRLLLFVQDDGCLVRPSALLLATLPAAFYGNPDSGMESSLDLPLAFLRCQLVCPKLVNRKFGRQDDRSINHATAVRATMGSGGRCRSAASNFRTKYIRRCGVRAQKVWKKYFQTLRCKRLFPFSTHVYCSGKRQ